MAIGKKIIAIMADLGAIGKNQKNTFQNYKFRGIDDMYNDLQPQLIKHGVIFIPRIVSKNVEIIQTETKSAKGEVNVKTQVHVSIEMEYTFLDVEDDTRVTVTVPAEGVDSGDKATYKALSGALKYALIQLLCIPTEDKSDPEYDSPERAAPAPAKKPAPINKPAKTTTLNQKKTELLNWVKTFRMLESKGEDLNLTDTQYIKEVAKQELNKETLDNESDIAIVRAAMEGGDYDISSGCPF